MTTKKVVADDTLGQVAKKQWELFRRVKDGTLNSTWVLNSLQGILENKAEKLEIEELDWVVSSEVYEIEVQEATFFAREVLSRGFKWKHESCSKGIFNLDGDSKKGPRRFNFRLARLTLAVPVHVIKTYAELSGYDLATSWDLLAFVKQSRATRIVRNECIIALGDNGSIDWPDTDKKSYTYVEADGNTDINSWIFDNWLFADTVELLDREDRMPVSKYILLKERK